MAYARCSEDSDIYLYANMQGSWDLYFCDGMRTPSERYYSIEAVKNRLADLIAEGKRIPDHTIERVDREYAQELEDGDPVALCPWCGRPARTDAFDTPIGTVTGIFWCEHCDTHELIGDLTDEAFRARLDARELETHWFRPSRLADTPLRFTRIGAQYEEDEIPF